MTARRNAFWLLRLDGEKASQRIYDMSARRIACVSFADFVKTGFKDRILKLYGANDRTTVREQFLHTHTNSRWMKMFEENREKLTGNTHFGRPSTSHTNENVDRDERWDDCTATQPSNSHYNTNMTTDFNIQRCASNWSSKCWRISRSLTEWRSRMCTARTQSNCVPNDTLQHRSKTTQKWASQK